MSTRCKSTSAQYIGHVICTSPDGESASTQSNEPSDHFRTDSAGGNSCEETGIHSPDKPLSHRVSPGLTPNPVQTNILLLFVHKMNINACRSVEVHSSYISPSRSRQGRGVSMAGHLMFNCHSQPHKNKLSPVPVLNVRRPISPPSGFVDRLPFWAVWLHGSTNPFCVWDKQILSSAKHPLSSKCLPRFGQMATFFRRITHSYTAKCPPRTTQKPYLPKPVRPL